MEIKFDPKPIYVEWIDSCSHLGWISKEELEQEEKTICKSLGYLVMENDETLGIACSLDTENGHFNNPIRIPKVAITFRKDISINISKVRKIKKRPELIVE